MSQHPQSENLVSRRQRQGFASEAGTLRPLLASILFCSFMPTALAEAPAEQEKVRMRIAPVARVEIMAAADAASTVAPAQPAASPASAPAAPAAAAAAAAAVKAPADEARALVERWARAWSERDVNQYLAVYAKGFTPDKGQSRTAWEQARRQKISSKKSISVAVRDLKVDADGDSRLQVRFLQDYAADGFREAGTPKSLTLAREDGTWLIVAETSGK